MVKLIKKKPFFINFEKFNYEKTAMFWFFLQKLCLVIFIEKNYNEKNLKNFFVYSFSYNISILLAFKGNITTDIKNKKKFNKNNLMVLFSTFKLFLVKYWNIELITIVFSIFFKKITSNQNIFFLKDNNKKEKIFKWIALFIKTTPVNQIKIFQICINFLFKCQRKYCFIFSIMGEKFLKNLIVYLSKNYTDCEYSRYLFYITIKSIESIRRLKKIYTYKYTILKNVKKLIKKKKKSISIVSKIKFICIIWEKCRKQKKKYNLLNRKIV
nr:hypothetical protein Cry52Nrm1_p052 [Cryptomonas curvata]